MWYKVFQKWRSLLHHLRAHENCKCWYFYCLCVCVSTSCMELKCWLVCGVKVWHWAVETTATTTEQEQWWKVLQYAVWGALIAAFDSGNTAIAVIGFIDRIWLWSAWLNQPLEEILKWICYTGWPGGDEIHFLEVSNLSDSLSTTGYFFLFREFPLPPCLSPGLMVKQKQSSATSVASNLQQKEINIFKVKEEAIGWSIESNIGSCVKSYVCNGTNNPKL